MPKLGKQAKTEIFLRTKNKSPSRLSLAWRVHFKLSHFVARNDIPARGIPFRNTCLRQFEMHPAWKGFCERFAEGDLRALICEGVQKSVAHLDLSIDNQRGSQGVPHFLEHSLIYR